jgi:outer membrane receptor protein involved in Fe transport
LWSCTLIATPAVADLRGRRVSDVLDELRAQGLTFIYSTQVLPPTLLVETEPTATKGVALAQEILGTHGLALSQAAPHVFAVVTGTAPVARATAAPDADVTRRPPIEEVVVQTSRYTLAAAQVSSETFLTHEEIQNMPRLADETLRVVQRLPGTTTNGFSSLGAVRGGEPNETAIVLDGLRLYEPFHLKNFLSPVSLLDSRVIEGIEFYSGGFPAVYGDRMSAIIDATTVRPAVPRYFELGLNLFHVSGLASMQFADGRGDALLSARRSNIGDLAHYSENDFGEPHYSDAFGRVDYELSDSTRTALDVLVSTDSIIANKADKTQTARADYRNVYTWATLDHDWSPRASTRVIASFTDLSNERHGRVDEPEQRVGTVMDNRIFHVVGLRVDNRFETDAIDHRFGAEVRRLWGQYHYSSDVAVFPDFPFPGSPGSTTTRKLDPSPDGFESSAWWDGRATLSNRWTLQAGMRIDTQTYDGSDDGEQYSPRLSVLYALGPYTHLRASWGRFHQSQGIDELQVEDGVEHFYPAQHADHTIVSLEHSFQAGIDLRVEAYRKRYRRINPRFENVFDPLVLFPEAEFDRVMIAPESALAEGVEMLLRLRPHGPWSGWFSYSWSRAQDRIDGRDVLRSWDQTHAINIGAVWARGPWTATLASSYHTGWPSTELRLDTSGSVPTLDLSDRNRSRVAYYNSVDLRVTRTFLMPVGALDVFVEVNNATDRSNPCCVTYDAITEPDGSVRFEREVESWLPLVPSAGVLWRF